MLRALKTINDIMFLDVKKRKRKDGEVMYLLYRDTDFIGYTLLTEKDSVFEINDFHISEDYSKSASEFLFRSAMAYIRDAGGDRARILADLKGYGLTDALGGKIDISVSDFFSNPCSGHK